MTPYPLLVLHYATHNFIALNVLLGALDTAPGLTAQREGSFEGDSTHLDVRIVNGIAKLVDLVEECDRSGGRALVCWSFYSPDFRRCAEQLRRVKERTSGFTVSHLAGGPHATAEPRSTLEAGFDAVAAGEGEATIREVSRRFAAGEEWRSVKGIVSMGDGELRNVGSGERVELDDYPAFAAERRRLNPIEITRGCIYACGFCQTPFMFKAKFRHRSVANVVEHVQIMTREGANYVRFITPTSMSYGADDVEPRLEKVEELLSSVRQALGARGKLYFGTFPSEVRPEHVTPEALAILRRYCSNTNLVIGGQSGSESVLTSSRRGHGVADVERAVRYAVEAGFVPNVDFILGLPGESAADMGLTLDFADRLTDLGARIHAHTFMPLPGTPTRNSPPGRVPPEALTRLERLGSRRKLYGQWKRQIGIAESLARERRA